MAKVASPLHRTAAALACGALALTGCSANSAAPVASSPAGPASVTTAAATASTPPSGAPVSSSSGAPGSTAATPSVSPAPLELPRGGTTVFPRYRLFGYSGAPFAPGQGRLGIGNLSQRVTEMTRRGAAYARGREVLPVMELIATTVHGAPGSDGMYRTRIEDATIKQWLRVARANKALLILNIQPGRADFLDELKAYKRWLVEPDVGVALDPEWAVDAGQIPGRVFGNTSGKELNACATWLADLVAQHQLPEKVMIYHQLHANIVRKESALKPHHGIVLVKSIDGIGAPGAKVATWKRIIKTTPRFVHPGFKLFYQEDVATGGRLMTATEVLALKPRPEYVLFE